MASDYVTTAVKLEFHVHVRVQFRRRVRCSSRRCRWYRQFKILDLFQILQILNLFLDDNVPRQKLPLGCSSRGLLSATLRQRLSIFR